MKLRILIVVLFVATGAFVGRLGAHQFGGMFDVPIAPDSAQWRIISPGLQEGIGPSGAGRVTHVRNGALSIATHVFFRPDMVVPLFSGQASSVEVELAPGSGTLWVQIGDSPGQFVQLRPGSMKGGAAGSGWTEADEERFVLSIDAGTLTVASGGSVMEVGPASPGRVELSAADDWPRVRSVEIRNAGGSLLFSSDFGARGTSARVLMYGTLLGALTGLMIAVLLSPVTLPGLAAVMIGLIPPALVLSQPDGVWLGMVERLYLKNLQPSRWAGWIFVWSLIPLLWMGAVSTVRAMSEHRDGPSRAHLLWCAAGLFSVFIGVQSWGLGAAVSVGCMLAGALRAGGRAPRSWWILDSFGWAPLVLFGAASAAPWVVLWRLASVVGTVDQWKQTSPRRAVDILFVAVCVFPFSLESAVADSSLGRAWQMDRLTTERPNERGWENPTPGWKDRCGPEESDNAITIAFAGGSSVGGAYQFGDEPEAFFPAVVHRELCATLPEGAALSTQNFGDGDLNTFTISRTLDAHLKDADVLVLYVGVNDILTRQNTRTRKQREQERSERGVLGSGLSGWVSTSSVMTGLSLWNRGLDDPTAQGVADVPLEDALENHQAIVSAVRARSGTVVFMTEHVQRGLVDSLRSYARMQQGLEGPGVVWLDASAAFGDMPESDVLLDRNHLSRAGNAALGRYIADSLGPELYGSSL